ncbi:MAG: CRISPR-associated RAMP protein Csx10 [Mastigocoleus sp.]
MKKIDLTITALSPLAIGRQKPGGSVSEALNYIPGTVIRGAIASQILQHYEFSQDNNQVIEENDDFQALFLGEEPAIFRNGYPSVAKIDKDTFKIVKNEEVLFLPTTAVSSKIESGFKPSNNGVFDTLIDNFCAEAFNLAYDPNDPKSLEDGTEPRVEPYSGFYSKGREDKKDKYYSHSVNTRFLTRVGINRRRATSEENILYSIEVLNESFSKSTKSKSWENVVYRSSILVENEELAKKLKCFINNQTFRLGGSASRGLGKVEMKAEIIDYTSEIKLRIDKFNSTLETRWKLWNSLFGNPNIELENQSKINQNKTNKTSINTDITYFTLNLQSDAILTEKWRSTTVISEAILKQFTGVKDESLKLEVAYSSYDYRSGWNSAWGLMKDVELVTNKGGVYLFSTTQPNDWYQAFAELELKGIGEKTCEGFGQVKICQDFHLILREDAV